MTEVIKVYHRFKKIKRKHDIQFMVGLISLILVINNRRGLRR